MATSTARLLMLVTAMLAASAALAGQRTYDKTLQAPPGGSLTFDTDVGSVAIVGHDAPEVVIHAELQGSEFFLDHFHIRASQKPSGVTISAHSAHSGWLGWLGWLDFGSNRARFAIEMPRDYSVDLRTSGGHVDIRDVSASVRAATSGGSMLVQNIAGTVTLHTSGGRIDAEHLDGPAQLSSSGGGIRVTDSTGGLDLSTSGGGIRLQNDDGRIRAVTSGGSIRAQLRGNRGVSLATSGGNITLLLPQNTRASIEAETSGGGIRTDFPVTTTQISGGDQLVGTIGGGGAPITLHSSGGSIHIETGE
ncbi:MAG: DUF4097 family beta strand repeat-containing protein [Steroidobacteraceae bacterium]